MKTEVKVETFEDFEAHEQLGTEFKTKVKTENFEDFEIRKQAVIDFITSKDY